MRTDRHRHFMSPALCLALFLLATSGCESHSTINDLNSAIADPDSDSGSDGGTDSGSETDTGETVFVHASPPCMDNAGLEIDPTGCAASVTIDTPSEVLNSTYARVEGTSSGVTLPMWFEVYDESDTMTDFGAFEAGEHWFFITRHLGGGANAIVVYGASGPDAITTGTLVLRVNEADDSPVRPRPFPAEVWWGGTADNAQLKDDPDGWSFVRAHADAFFCHTAAWSDDMNPTMESLVTALRPVGAKFAAKLGGQTATDANWPRWMHEQWGAGADGWVINRFNETGLILSEMTHDFHPMVKDFAETYPEMNEAQIIELMARYWKEYFTLNYGVFPHLKHANSQSPLGWNWGDFKALGGDLGDDDYVFSLNGADYDFDFADIMAAMREIGDDIPGHDEWAFYSDFPYHAMVWTDDAPYDGAHVRK